MKRLTVDQTWEQCLAMWKWISRRRKGVECTEVNKLKEKWLKANNYQGIEHDCFFCHKCLQSHHDGIICCCPAKKIDPNFNCFSLTYHHTSKPRLFYAELKRLNKIRLAKK